MKLAKYISVGSAACFGLLTFCLAMIRGGWPGNFIMPYLFVAALLALVPAFFVWFVASSRLKVGVSNYFIAASIFYFTFALAAGLLVTVAENIARQMDGYVGEIDKHAFYPNDSGMSHWPTPWSRIPIVAFFLSFIWLPCLYLTALLSTKLGETTGSNRLLQA